MPDPTLAELLALSKQLALSDPAYLKTALSPHLLPNDALKVLRVNAGGTALEFGVPSGAPGGLDTQVQFNDGGVFGGALNATWNKAVNQLTIGSDAALPSGFQLLNYLGTNVSLELAASAHEASALYLVAASDGGGAGFISPLYLVASATADIVTQGFTCDVYGFDGGTKATVGFESDANSGAASSGFTAGAAAGGTAGAGATGNIAGFAVKSGIGLNFKSAATTPVMADFYAGVPTTALATINAGFYAEDFGANYALYLAGGKVHLSLPTADPHVVGVLWANAGVVTVSAG